MTLCEHLKKISYGDITPRVIEHSHHTWVTAYVAWTPVWEGPARPDYAAAHADLTERRRQMAGPAETGL